jgi:hypothetical protein
MLQPAISQAELALGKLFGVRQKSKGRQSNTSATIHIENDWILDRLEITLLFQSAFTK